MRKVPLHLLAILVVGLGFVLFNPGIAFQAPTGQTTRAPQAPLGAGFTYQGRLDVDGAPADGVYDFQFRLYDAATDGSQVGGTVTVGDVTVTGGLFNALLDFGEAPFDGDARWLEIAVRSGDSDGAYSSLFPRQQLSATPYALHALNAQQAQSVDWTAIQNRPAGLDDGDDDTTYTAGAGLVLNGAQFAAQGSPYANVVVVAQSGGDFTSVQAALDSITGASAANPYLLYVAPGVYEEQVTLKPYVTLEGAGQGATIIRWTGGSEAPWEGAGSATLIGADNASIRRLTVENDGTGHAFGVAIYNNDAEMIMDHVTGSAWDATDNRGVANYNDSAVTMTNVTASGSGGDHSHGVANDRSTIVMRDVRATATNGLVNYGIINWITGSPAMLNVSVMASGSGSSNYGVFNNFSSPNINGGIVRAADGNTNRGIYNWNNSASVIQGARILVTGGSINRGVDNLGSAAWLIDLTISATGGSSINAGVNNENSPAVLHNLTILAMDGNSSMGVRNVNSSPDMMNVRATTAGAVNNYGVFNHASSPQIRQSLLEGSTNSVYQNGGSAEVAYSELIGPVDSGLLCLNNYDQNLNPVVCP